MTETGNQNLCSNNESVNRNELVANDETVEEFENETALENHCELNEEMLGEDSELVPKVGMKFKDDNEVFEYYKRYACRAGFPVRRRSSKKGEDGIVRNVTFVCSGEGRKISSSSNSLNNHPTIKRGCKARLRACSDVCGIWRINTVHLEHNHELSHSMSRIYRCNRQLGANVRQKRDVDDVAENSLSSCYTSVDVEEGGYEDMVFSEKNGRDPIDEARRLKLGEGGAAAIQTYFSKMQIQCPGFFYSIDFDEELRLRNVFWADNRSREAYKEFGDVVSFDTTYLTNKYDIPLVTFVGVNHHGQSILLGCGLVSNEDTKTFVWLFKTWLHCMHDQAPSAIITSQAGGMRNAIQVVFPNSQHRWCSWHILKMLPKKIDGHVHKSDILSSMNGLVYDSRSMKEFEQRWNMMIDSFMLCDNEWLSELYKERDHWVPCFLKTYFWASMSTTKPNGTKNAFFDGYIHSKTTLNQFFDKYERALRSMVEKEFQADFKSFSQIIPCATIYMMEKQFQDVYTISKFREVQEEFTGKIYCDIFSTHEEFFGTRYEVREDMISKEGMMNKEIFMVLFQKEKCEVVCTCHLFEFKGILCRHAISVLTHNAVTSIPEMYILRRWQKDVPRSHTRVKINYNGWISTPQHVRYEELCQAFAGLANLVADDEEQTRLIKQWIESNELMRCSKRPKYALQ